MFEIPLLLDCDHSQCALWFNNNHENNDSDIDITIPRIEFSKKL